MTPVTIGDQKFIKDSDKGWIDSKTKQPADKGLIRLLDSLVINEPVLKRLRTKIDRTVEPVSFGGQKFVYDVNQGWIDEKTKIPVPPALQSTLNSVIEKPTVPDVSASMGIVAAAGLQQTQIKTPRQKTGSGTLVHNTINKPIVKMIGTLASMDMLLKQRLDNQKFIAQNDLLTARESQIEAGNQSPELQVIKPDAEKVSGSAAGALAIGGLLLLTLDPVQEAIKSIVSGVVETGKFITSVVSSINKAFTFLFSSTGTDPTAIESQPSATPQSQPQASVTPTPETGMAETTADAELVTSEEKPSFTAAVSAGAATGAVVGAVVPRVGMVAGAVVGGAIAAVKHVSSGGSSNSSSGAALQAAPVASGGSAPTAVSTPDATRSAAAGSAPDAKAETKDAQPSATGEIPKNNIVALGNYLIAKGADRSKMQHSAFGPVGEHSKNSRHYRNMAIDVNFSGPDEAAKLDALEPQLRAAGYNTIWRKPGHYTHMHVSVGGPEGSGGGSSMGDSHTFMQMTADTVNAGAGKLGELFGMLGSAIIKPGVPRDKEDYSKAITAAAVQTNTETAVAKTPKPLPNLSTPKPANINKSGTGATQNAATTADKDSVYYYLRRFGFQELSAPVKPAKVA
jgi:hypothetical protein